MRAPGAGRRLPLARHKSAKDDTPVGHPPGVLITAVATLTRQLPPFDRISVGFASPFEFASPALATAAGPAGFPSMPL